RSRAARERRWMKSCAPASGSAPWRSSGPRGSRLARWLCTGPSGGFCWSAMRAWESPPGHARSFPTRCSRTSGGSWIRCGPARCSERTGLPALRGDGDPMDICVLSEKEYAQGGFLLHARAVGGLRMLDGDEVDDKLLAVLEKDLVYGKMEDVSQVPTELVDRL